MDNDRSGDRADGARAALTRRTFIKSTGYGAGALAVTGPLGLASPAIAADATIKVGFISPLTGPLAGFGETDPYILTQVRKALASGVDDRRQDIRRRDHRQGHAVGPGRAPASSPRS